MPTILIISSDSDTTTTLGDTLSLEGHIVRTAATGEAALSEAMKWKPKVIVLDLALSDGDGHAVLRRLRAEYERTIIVTLSECTAEADVVLALRCGADALVPKPIRMLEFLARVDALLRRASHPRRAATVTRFADVEIDRTAQRVWRSGRLVPVGPIEFQLLHALVERGGAAVSRRELLEEVWKSSPDRRTRTVDIHIAQLRRKLDDDAERNEIIETVWGFGYRLSSRHRVRHAAATPAVFGRARANPRLP